VQIGPGAGRRLAHAADDPTRSRARAGLCSRMTVARR
jgi:hypothetical protein